MIYDIYAVGNTLRSIRNKYGYTQNDMAESLDVSYIHYSQIEQGRHRMSLELMLKIVTKYGVDPKIHCLELKAGKNVRIKRCLYWKINCRCLNQMIENMQCLHV